MSSSNEYMRGYMLRRYHARRQEAITFLGGACVGCGCSELAQLELDHIDPKQKSFDISKAGSIRLELFWEEVKKCQLLCTPCHEDKTLKERGQVSAKGTHGTLSAYRHCGPPKCAICRTVNTAWNRDYRRRRPKAGHLTFNQDCAGPNPAGGTNFHSQRARKPHRPTPSLKP